MSLTGEYFSEATYPTLLDSRVEAGSQATSPDAMVVEAAPAAPNKYTDMLADAATAAALRAATGQF